MEDTEKIIEITPQSLIAAGWKKIGSAWYLVGNKKSISNSDDKFQKWLNGMPTEIKYMNEL